MFPRFAAHVNGSSCGDGKEPIPETQEIQEVRDAVSLLRVECEEMSESLEALTEVRPVCNEPHIAWRAAPEFFKAAPRTCVLDRKYFL